jgi:hypothetical protein
MLGYGTKSLGSNIGIQVRNKVQNIRIISLKVQILGYRIHEEQGAKNGIQVRRRTKVNLVVALLSELYIPFITLFPLLQKYKLTCDEALIICEKPFRINSCIYRYEYEVL